MTDRTDGSRPDDGDASADSDPFEYPADTGNQADPSGSPPPGIPDAGDDRPTGFLGWIRWFWTTETAPAIYLRDVLVSFAIVLVIGAILFAASGVWPPMVAVESGSMEPNVQEGDLIFLIDNERFTPDGATETGGVSTGIVPADVAERNGRTSLGEHGDVIVFHPNGNAGRTPIIHRAMFFVDAGENWYDRADSEAISDAENCEALAHCPAPHAGFITKGDNEVTNRHYDQTSQLSAPVRPEWIVGTAELRIPYLGRVRLMFSTATVDPVGTATASDLPPDPWITGSSEPSETVIFDEPARASSPPA